jgi:hypothetical protein
MPILQNPRHEAFAQARAKGATLDDAYEDAGYVPSAGHGCRLAQRDDVARRIAELRAAQGALTAAGSRSVIAALLRIAAAGESLGHAAGMKEARLTLIEARRLAGELAAARADERSPQIQRSLENALENQQPWPAIRPARLAISLPLACLPPARTLPADCQETAKKLPNPASELPLPNVKAGLDVPAMTRGG